MSICTRLLGRLTVIIGLNQSFKVFWRLRKSRATLTANVFGTKRDPRTVLETTKRFYSVPKFHARWRTNGLKRSFFTYRQYSASLTPIVHTASGINVAPHSESKWNDIGLLCSASCAVVTWEIKLFGNNLEILSVFSHVTTSAVGVLIISTTVNMFDYIHELQ